MAGKFRGGADGLVVLPLLGLLWLSEKISAVWHAVRRGFKRGW